MKTMKTLIALLPTLCLSQAFAGDSPVPSASAPEAIKAPHRYHD